MIRKTQLRQVDKIKPSTTSNLVNTDRYEWITPKNHGTKYSLNMMRSLFGNSVPVQPHPEEHAINVLEDECKILLGEEWVHVL
jgi:hypothetical protein